MFKPCIVIPVYRHTKALERQIPSLLSTKVPLIVVDDGNPTQDRTLLLKISKQNNFSLLTLEQNQGKGAAVYLAMQKARALGFTHALQIDADGQHQATDIPLFLASAKSNPKKLILGYPIFDSSAPFARVYGRKLTTWAIAVQTLSFAVKDGLCGFRVYPLASTLASYSKKDLAPRMGFDPSVVVHLRWAGLEVINIATAVKYPENGSSNFHYLTDNLSLIRLYSKLFFCSFLRYPSLIIKKLKPRDSGAWYTKKEHGSRMALSIVLRVYKLGGQGLLLLLLWPVIFYFWIIDSAARKSSKKYLDQVNQLSPHSVTTLQHFYSFGRKIVDSIVAWSGDFRLEQIDWQGKERIFEMVEKGQGALVLGAHIGCLEVTRAMHQQKPGLIITPLMHLSNARIFRNFLLQVNPDAEESIMALENFNSAAAIQIEKRIQKGEFVAILADRISSEASQRTLEGMFLGKKCHLPEGPFALAKALDCPVFSFFSFKDKSTGRYQAIWTEMNNQTAKSRSQKRLRMQNLLDDYLKQLEEICLTNPDQWFNFFNFWKTAAPKPDSQVSNWDRH